MDKLYQIALWIAFRMLRVWWWLRRPSHEGALIALWHAGEVVLVQTSYRLKLTLPGGGVNRGEAPLAAALREFREECGIDLSAADLKLAFEMVDRSEYRHDHVRIYEASTTTPPLISVDRREILWARLFTPEAALAGPLTLHVRRYLEARSAGQGQRVAAVGER
jgi:8-oxo-dGTP pyrophosphatase MutT (NUDIX family)